jgi:hypothetical protein
MSQADEIDDGRGRGHEILMARKRSAAPVRMLVMQAPGFRHNRLRGIGKVGLEWKPVTWAYDRKRVFAQ